MNILDNSDITLATQAQKDEKRQKKLNAYLNFFTTDKVHRPKKFMKKSLIYIGSFLLMSQALFAISDYHHLTNYEELVAQNTINLSANNATLKKSIQNNDEQAIMVNYLKTMQQQSYISNMLMASFTLNIMQDSKVSEKTKNIILQIWKENQFTGVNNEYQSYKKMSSCLSMDMICRVWNNHENFDDYDKVIRERITTINYRIDHLAEYNQTIKDKIAIEKSDYYQKEQQYVANHALLSRPDDKKIERMIEDD